MDLPPNVHSHTGVTSPTASIASSTTVPTLRDSPTDYFDQGKPIVVGEERFRSLTELKWGEFESNGLWGLESSETVAPIAGRNDLPHARSTDDGRWMGKGDAETTNETKTGRGELRRGGAIQRLGHVVANETCDTRVGSLARGLAVSGSLVEAPVEDKQGSN
jgi:hypothetical protein